MRMVLAKMTEMEIDERLTVIERVVPKIGRLEEKMKEMKRLWEENMERFEHLERLWIKKEKSTGISEEEAQSQEQITSQVEKPMTSDDSIPETSSYAMDQVMDRSKQCVRKLTPLVVGQQPERNTVTFREPVMVVQERMSRSSDLEWFEKLLIEVAGERGISMKKLEETRGMTGHMRLNPPVTKLEDKNENHVFLLDELNHVVTGKNVAGEEESPATMIDLFEKVSSVECKGNMTRKKKKRWKMPEKFLDCVMKGCSFAGSKMIDPSRGELFGFVGSEGMVKHQREGEKQTMGERDNHASQLFDEMFLRGKRVKMKIKKRMLWFCDSKKSVKRKRIKQELVFGELVQGRKEVLAKLARWEKCKFKQLNKLINLRLSDNQTLLFWITKLASDLLLGRKRRSMIFISKEKNISAGQRKSLMRRGKAGNCQLIYLHQMLNRKWTLGFKKEKKKKGRMRVELDEKGIEYSHGLMNARLTMGDKGVKRQLVTERILKFKYKHHNGNKKIGDMFLSADRRKRPKSEYKLVSCEKLGLLISVWTKIRIKWKVIKLGLLLAQSLRRQLAVGKGQCDGNYYIRCDKELQLRGLMRSLTANVKKIAGPAVNSGILLSFDAIEWKKILMEWEKLRAAYEYKKRHSARSTMRLPRKYDVNLVNLMRKQFLTKGKRAKFREGVMSSGRAKFKQGVMSNGRAKFRQKEMSNGLGCLEVLSPPRMAGKKASYKSLCGFVFLFHILENQIMESVSLPGDVEYYDPETVHGKSNQRSSGQNWCKL
ncbi:hypothetical protein F2Q69_00021520 [Brassica cretica]|uniref:Uncharacterized protein n=1 Tax=Brassica cretica TaxID=69181 RepID=A0A8S9PY42_BRACR|nr:hypothetical protein F2Q69_00021520 [Brassica cretica]